MSSTTTNSTTTTTTTTLLNSPTINAAIAGVVAVALTHPIDTFVVHKQTNRILQPTFTTLYRGLLPALGQAAIIYGVMLGSYEYLKQQDFTPALAGAVSAVPESMVKGPLEAIKNNRQTGRPSWPCGIAARVNFLAWSTAGMMLREIPGNVCYFWTYEECRKRQWHPFFAGAAAATAFTAAVYPLDAYRAQKVTGAPTRFTWQGVVPYWIRGMAVTGILFTCYEALQSKSTVRVRGAA